MRDIDFWVVDLWVVCFTHGNQNPERGMVSLVFVYYLKDLHHTSLKDTPALQPFLSFATFY